MALVLNIPEAVAETVLAKLQTIEPAGLFSRSLKECLQLQAASHDNNSPQFAILLDSLDVLAAGDMKALKKKCGVSSDQLRDMINLLRSFNPKPGTLFETGADPIRAPDLIVTKNSDGWRIDLNRSTLPRMVKMLCQHLVVDLAIVILKMLQIIYCKNLAKIGNKYYCHYY